MQEIAPGGFQIMWKRYSVLLISTIWNASMTSPGLTSLYLSIDIFLGVVFFNEASVVKAVSVDETETIYGYYQINIVMKHSTKKIIA